MSAKTTGRMTKHDMKQDKFVSWIFYLVEQFRHKKVLVLGVAGGIVAVVALVWMISNHQTTQREEVRELFGRASIEMRSQSTSLAIIDFRKILDDYGSSDLAGLACYYLANAYYSQRDFNEAEILFKRYLDDYGDDPLLVIAAHWGIAGCMEQRGEFGSAADEYLAAANIDLQGIMAGDLLFASIRAACTGEDSARALKAYQIAEEYYGDTPRVIDAAKLYMYEKGYLKPSVE